MQPNDLRKDWVNRLAQDGWLDLHLLTEGLEETLAKEARQIGAKEMASMLLSGVDEAYVRTESERVYIAIPALFKRYGEWALWLGAQCGFNTDGDDMVDDWVSESMPETRAIIWALTDIVGDFMAEAAKKVRAERGYSPVEVFAKSVSTGESFDQSKARLEHSAKGLTIVKSRKPAKTNKSKYGNMPVAPNYTAKVKGDSGTYKVWGIDWMNHRVLLDRAGLEWTPIKNVTFEPSLADQES